MSTHMRDPDGSIDARWNYWGTKPEINVEEVILSVRREWLYPMQMRMYKKKMCKRADEQNSEMTPHKEQRNIK